MCVCIQLAQSPLHHEYTPALPGEVTEECSSGHTAEETSTEFLGQWLQHYLDDYDTESDEEESSNGDEES